jgi:hypothetical protein
VVHPAVCRALVVSALLVASSAHAWERRDSWVTALSPEDQAALVNIPATAGRDLGDGSEIDPLPRVRPAAPDGTLPAAFSWQDRDGVDWMMPIRNQERCGSCAAFGITALLEIRTKIDLDAPGLPVDLADSQTLTCAGGDCENGITLPQGIAVMQDQGLVVEECAPYRENGNSVDLTGCDELCDAENRGRVYLTDAQIVDIDGIELAEQVAIMKKAILDSPLLVRIAVWSDLFPYGSGTYVPESEDPSGIVGYHALLLIGWDDSRQAWLARNSWGTDWGMAGYLFLGWGVSDSHRIVFQALGSDAHALYDIDRDGFVSIEHGGADCADFDPDTHPGADDPRDGVDSDCDGTVETPGNSGCAGGAGALVPLIALPSRRRRPLGTKPVG